MNLRLIKAVDMKQMPWRNGGGATSEVAISPQASELAKLDFDWRASIATIEGDGPFSTFEGYDRWLVVWSGEGLKVNGTEYLKLKPFCFSGEERIDAKLVSGRVKDFGLIYSRERKDAEMTAHFLPEGGFLAHEVKGDSFVLCATGEIRVGEFYLNPGDVVHTNGDGKIAITALANSNFVLSSLTQARTSKA